MKLKNGIDQDVPEWKHDYVLFCFQKKKVAGKQV